MSLWCCIGGYCTPYSALIPLVLWCLQWLVKNFGLKSYIPDKWWNLLQSNKTQASKQRQKKQPSKQPSCCSTTASTPDLSLHSNTTTDPSKSKSLVRSIDSEEEWNKLKELTQLSNNNNNNNNNNNKRTKKDKDTSGDVSVVVIVKFTATWCRPCHAIPIQPVFEALAAAAAITERSKSNNGGNNSRAIFGTIDVDEVESVASDLKIGVLPTVVVVKGGIVVDRYTGSDAEQLQDFCNRHTTTCHKEYRNERVQEVR
jgi:thiol-disulfide isomerase/thioredoxin